MTASIAPYRVSLRIYVVFSLLMAVSAAASGLLLLYLARPFITALGREGAQATVLLFAGAGAAGALAAVGGLLVGLRFAGRIHGIVRKAEALSPPAAGGAPQKVTDELGALDAAVGRLTLSMDQFVRDSDILGRLPEGMLLVWPSGELISFNATAESLLGIPLGPFRGQPLLADGGPLPMRRGNEALARLLEDGGAQHGVTRSEVVVRTSAGQSLLLEATVQRRDWVGSTAVVLLFRDASEKHRIREEIRRADQLAFLGGMAARVAHEIRTPLATIRGLLELMEVDMPAGAARAEYMTRLLQAVDRQDRLVENLLTLSHPEPESSEPVSLPALISDVVSMLPRDTRLCVSAAGGAALLPVLGDPLRLGEVFTNLIQNALEATPAAGVVEVRIEPRDGRARVVVRNTGSGIPLELRARIFQPFFTTKSRGTGLGLAIAREIVDAHRGSIEVQSDGVSETAFVVELPTLAAAGPPAARVGAAGETGWPSAS